MHRWDFLLTAVVPGHGTSPRSEEAHGSKGLGRSSKPVHITGIILSCCMLMIQGRSIAEHMAKNIWEVKLPPSKVLQTPIP